MFHVQFAFRSIDRSPSDPILERDKGYIEIVSSVSKATYWGNPATLLLRAEQGKRISIKEQGPTQHQPQSSRKYFCLSRIVFCSKYAFKTLSLCFKLIISVNHYLLRYSREDAGGLSREYVLRIASVS